MTFVCYLLRLKYLSFPSTAARRAAFLSQSNWRGGELSNSTTTLKRLNKVNTKNADCQAIRSQGGSDRGAPKQGLSVRLNEVSQTRMVSGYTVAPIRAEPPWSIAGRKVECLPQRSSPLFVFCPSVIYLTRPQAMGRGGTRETADPVTGGASRGTCDVTRCA